MTAGTGGAAVVEVVGELDLATVPQWEAAVERAAADAPLVVLDLSTLSFVDSAGVHALFRMLSALDGRSKRLVIVAPPESTVRRLLDILDLTALALVCDSRAEALSIPPRSAP
jgi:anti-sigma B factor antagonist